MSFPLRSASLIILRTAAAVGAIEIEFSKRLYVGNIPPGCTPDELRAAFANSGLNIGDIVGPFRPSGNSSRLFTFVDMEDGRSAMEAVDSQDISLKGRRLVINEAHSLPSQVTPQRNGRTPRLDITERLYIAGLPFTASESSVRGLFQNHGLNPVEVYLPKDRQTGRVRGFGFVSMSSESEATQAIGALNGSLVEGRSITVRGARPHVE